ncbi:hypothetical protein PAECIP111802_05277 [Paenibacillus allorhizosphaerae]|uniref:Uncharacterized protein n=1 Tax=Paenibacillus allorhizosphaerae TaxID=2849866 RepID=A0ABN7TUR4_9BACL|nr:hypothetical protein PAECIP111802_05277 [Paenibacillus allorhizosphaerae]
MKIILIFFLMFFLNMSLAVMVDLIKGMNLSMSLSVIRHSFAAMSLAEYIIIYGMLCLLFISVFTPLFKMKNADRTPSQPPNASPTKKK